MNESMNKAQRMFSFSLINEYRRLKKKVERNRLATTKIEGNWPYWMKGLSCPLKLMKDNENKGRIMSLRNEITCG